jgi:hypothetical protein
MRADSVVVVHVTLDGPSKMPLAKDDCVIQAFSLDRADHALRVRVLPRRGRSCQNLLDADGRDLPTEALFENAVPISNQVLRLILWINCLNFGSGSGRPFFLHLRVQW